MPAKHLPCGPFVNQSERDASERVKSFLDSLPDADDWVLFTNLTHAFRDRRQSDEIDQVAIGPSGIHLIEVKHWNRNFIAENPDIVRDEARKLVEKVKKVASKLRPLFPSLPRLFGKFLFTAELEPLGRDRPCAEQCEYFSMSEIRNMFSTAGSTVLTRAEVRRITMSIEPRAKVALDGDLRHLNNIVEMNLLTPRTDRFHRVYNGKRADTREPVIVHLYDRSAYSGPGSRDFRLIEQIARREFDALQRLQKFPWLPKLLDSFQYVPGYPGELFFFSLNDPLAPPLVRRTKDRRWSASDRLTYARCAARALQAMHEAGGELGPFLHRNLTPETMLVRNNSDILLVGLHLAKIPEQLTVSSGARTSDSEYPAPEVRAGGLAAASPRSDVFSLCKSLLTIVEPDSDMASLGEVLRNGLADDPSGRPSPEDLARRLDDLVKPVSPQVPPPRQSVPPPEDWEEGLVVTLDQHDFRVSSRLGEGGCGLAFRVVELDPETREEGGNFVAKVTHSGTQQDSLLRAYRRVRPLSDGPHLAVVFVVAAAGVNSGPLALLKWVEGEPLDGLRGVFELYAEERELPDSDPERLALRWMADLCRALAHLHRGGVIHGDVSPRNIIYRDDIVTLTDYDLVKRIGDLAEGLGAPDYRPAQAAIGRPVSASDDVFALAATFFHVIYERKPFLHGTSHDPAKGIAWEGLPRDRWPRLTEFLDKATAPAPADRFADGATALAYLERILAAGPVPIEENSIHIANDETLAPLEVSMDTLALSLGDLAAHAEQRVRVVGIDLGTTNSTVAEIVYDPKSSVPVIRCLEIDQKTAEGLYTHVLVPSVVATQPSGTLVGEGAKRLRSLASERNLEQNKDLFWECKNDMGLRKTYHRALTGFRSAKEIAGHVLTFLSQAARLHDEQPIDRIVVTVPASFQTAQRQDTLEAGRLAGLELVGGDLLDEPVAAFLDRLFATESVEWAKPNQSRNLIVFDFGGGTCDVAIFRLVMPAGRGLPRVGPLAVSRYHRLGGGDIDAAIVYDVLLPQLLQQNQVAEQDLTFTDKKRWVEPAFLGVAEALKIGLSAEILRLYQFGKYPPANLSEVQKKLPGVYQCRLPDGRILRLQSPTLNAEQFEKVLTPFLDADLLYPQETEYRTTCSIFSPLADAMTRAGLRREDIDLFLMVGGSSLLLPVCEALKKYFPNARQLAPKGADAVQTAVARGAAYHALALTLTGRGIVQPIAADRISIRSKGDDGSLHAVELIPRHAPLPFPADERWAEKREFAVPYSSDREPVELRIELVDSDDNQLIRVVWKMPAPLRQGAPLVLRYRMDENQLLKLMLVLPGQPGDGFSFTLENPLTNVVNPQEQRQKIDAIEEALRTNQIPREEFADKLAELAALYEVLGQRERALDLLRRALQARGRPDPNLLNLMGNLCDALRDQSRAERFYRESAEHSNDGAPLFNLALMRKKNGQNNLALEAIDEALEREKDAPYFVLKAQIADVLRNTELRDECLGEAFRQFDSPEQLSDWSLAWFEAAANMAGDTDAARDAQATRASRKKTKGADTEVSGELPKHSGPSQEAL